MLPYLECFASLPLIGLSLTSATDAENKDDQQTAYLALPRLSSSSLRYISLWSSTWGGSVRHVVSFPPRSIRERQLWAVPTACSSWGKPESVTHSFQHHPASTLCFAPPRYSLRCCLPSRLLGRRLSKSVPSIQASLFLSRSD